MAFEKELLEELRPELGRRLVKYGREVLTGRTHIRTGNLRRSLRWRPLKRGVRLSGLFYGEILQARKLEMKKVPPGPQREGWIEEAVRLTIEDFNDDGRLQENLAQIVANDVKRIFVLTGDYK